ncbi:hypothetical protein [Asticcacaulis sp.]|uniref:hypothetical protein n=1 Tax=Asticcacaulis sp. TaxID=1872648 RepID=UPI002602FADB|nr:hypothetical protein [Asticcacaulis sp.]
MTNIIALLRKHKRGSAVAGTLVTLALLLAGVDQDTAQLIGTQAGEVVNVSP